MRVYILAGGSGARLTAEKGFLTVGGRTILDRVRAAAEPLASEIALVGRGDRLRQEGLRVISEADPGVAGPLGAVCAALADAAPNEALILPWDAPFITTPLLACLREARCTADAAVPRRGESVEPLFAVYGPRCLGPAQRALAAGNRRVIAFYDELAVRWVGADELSAFGEWDRLFLNVNTPDDLEHARQMAGGA